MPEIDNHEELIDWLDVNHANRIRTQAASLDGPALGKYLNRPKFLKSVPDGHSIGDMALAMDMGGVPYFNFWSDFRGDALGDIIIRPDLNTLCPDSKDKNLAHCIGDFYSVEGEPINICPRGTLKRLTAALAKRGLTAKTTFELEFFLFHDSFAEARLKGYNRLRPLRTSAMPNIYHLRNAYQAKPFMDEALHRLEKLGIEWEAWNDEEGPGQVELNLLPTDPVTAADNVMRTKLCLYETAMDLDMSLTFMPKIAADIGSGMHIHHSLHQTDPKGESTSAFFDPSQPDNRSMLMKQWLAGLLQTMQGATSIMSPTINSYRRMVDFSAVPLTSSWGEENKSSGLRVISRNPALTRIEYRLGASDINPYLALATIFAGGLAGITNDLSLPEETRLLAWGLPDSYPKLPNNIQAAARALTEDQLLTEFLGTDLVTTWSKSREWEWLIFHTEGGDPEAKEATDWELQRYFEIV